MTTVSNPRGRTVLIGARRFPVPVPLDYVVPLDCKRISLIPWLDRTAVLADVESDFESISLYAWDGEFFWGVGTEALESRVWQRIISVVDNNLANFGTIDLKRSRYVAAVAKGLQKFAVRRRWMKMLMLTFGVTGF